MLVLHEGVAVERAIKVATAGETGTMASYISLTDLRGTVS